MIVYIDIIFLVNLIIDGLFALDYRLVEEAELSLVEVAVIRRHRSRLCRVSIFPAS